MKKLMAFVMLPIIALVLLFGGNGVAFAAQDQH